MNEVDEFLGGLDNSPKDDVFKPEVADPFKREDTKVEGDEKKDDKPLPFHQDPKVQRFIAKEVEKRLGDRQPEVERFVQETKSEESDEVMDVLTRIIGNDTPEKLAAIKDFKKVLGNLEEKGAQRALAQLDAQANEERQAEIEAQNELADGFQAIEDTFDVDLTSSNPQAKKERSEFVDFIKRVSPKDEDGQVTSFPDLEETYKLFKETKKPESNNRAKELSSRSMARSSDASNVQQTGDKSWRAVEKIFSKFNS